MEVSVAPDQQAEAREENLRMIEDSAVSIVQNDRHRARKQRFSSPGFDRDKWREFAEQGWLLLRVPEERDGLGMGLSELCTISRCMGRELTPEPIHIAAAIAPALADELLAEVAAGEKIILPLFEPFTTAKDADGTTKVQQESKREGYIFGAEGADDFLVQIDKDAAVIAADSPDLKKNLHNTHDGGTITHVSCTGPKGAETLRSLCDLKEEATLVHAAYLLGVAESMNEITLNYLQDRSQFGRAIGSFQSLQHRAVDMFLDISLMRSTVNLAAATIDDGAPQKSMQQQVSLALASAIKGVMHVGEEAIQMHGGIGYTDEADIGLYLRKAMSISGLFGTEEFHRHRLLTLSEAE